MRVKIVAWTAGLVLAVATGWLQILFRDLHLALLAAMAFGMTLSLIDPQRPWRWGLLIGLAPAAGEFYLIARGDPIMRGQVEVAFGAVLPAFVGAISGYALRRMVGRVYEQPPEAYRRASVGGAEMRTEEGRTRADAQRP